MERVPKSSLLGAQCTGKPVEMGTNVLDKEERFF